MTGFLASVADPGEMEIARAGGADIVDLKDPAHGALGAWEISALRDAVALSCGWTGRTPVLSATIGDQPMRPETVRAAAEAVAETGVPLVKLGVFSDGDPAACLAALAPLARRTKLIAVFFGDLRPDPALLDLVADLGFYGAMLDTADKSAGGLRRHLDDGALAAFVASARGRELVVGLAGSLARGDVAPLGALAPDYLGFRGALCKSGRTGRIDAGAVADIAALIAGRRDAA